MENEVREGGSANRGAEGKRGHAFANVALVLSVVFFLTGFIYSLLCSAFYAPGQTRIYQIISLVGVILSGVALQWGGSLKVGIALTMVATFIAVYLGEVVLFCLQPYIQVSPGDTKQWTKERLAAVKRDGIRFDSRSRRQVIDDLRKKGIAAFPTVGPVNFVRGNGLQVPDKANRLFPLGGISNVTTVDWNEAGTYPTVQADEHGFRNPRGSWDGEKPDVMMIGDSFTYGFCVPTGDEVAAQLRRLTGKKVISIGMPGNGPLLELASLIEYGRGLKPKVVLWQFYDNDLDDLTGEMRSELLRGYLQKPEFSQDLLHRQHDVDQALRLLVNAKMKGPPGGKERPEVRLSRLKCIPKLCHWRRLVFGDATVSTQQGLERRVRLSHQLKLFQQVLHRAKTVTSAWGGTLVFVFLPCFDECVSHDHGFRIPCLHEVQSIVKDLDIPFINFCDVCDSHPDPPSLFPLRSSLHYNAQGYRLLAELLNAKAAPLLTSPQRAVQP